MDVLRVKFLSFKNVVSRYAARYPLRFFCIVSGVLVVATGAYFLLQEAFNLLNTLGGLGTIILRRLFYILFSILFFMIAISFSILFYSCAFRSSETNFLLTHPLALGRILKEKYTEAAILACWLPFFGVMLFIFVYCRISHLSPLYVVAFLFFLVPFLCLCALVGVFLLLVIVRFFSIKKVIAFCVIALVAGIITYYRRFPQDSVATSYFITEDFAFLRFSRTWYLPFYWITEGFIKLEESRFFYSFVFLMNLWSLTLLGLRALPFLGKKLFQECFFVCAGGSSKKVYTRSIWDRLFQFVPCSGDFKEFMLKDIKLFLRDPRQWLQALIFFGLLFFYFLNIRYFSYHDMGPVWQNLIMFLNAFGILCIVSTLSVRFIFPLWSLEGHNFWILKLSPVPLRKIFMEKLVLAISFFVPISFVLILTSNIMLQVEGFFFYFTLFLVPLSCITLVTMSLSLGAYFADFKTSYLLKAVESFGGFLTLVCNLGYLIFSIFTFFLITHFSIAGKFNIDLEKMLCISGLGWLVLSVVICVVSVLMGLNGLEKKEI